MSVPFFRLLVVSVASGLCFITGMNHWLQADLPHLGDDRDLWTPKGGPGYTVGHWFALLLYVVAFPIFLISTTQLSLLTYTTKIFTRHVRLVFFFCLAVLALTGFVLSWSESELMPCLVLGCVTASVTGGKREHYTTGGGLKQVYLVGICCTMLLLFLAQCALLVLTYFRDRSDNSRGDKQPLLLSLNSTSAPGSPVKHAETLAQKDWKMSLYAVIGTFGVMLPLLFFASCILPNAWERFLVNRMIGEAQMVISTNSSDCGVFDPPFHSCPEVDGAVFRTVSFKLAPNVNAKVYPDIAMFYLYMYGLAGLTLVGNWVPTLRRRFHARLAGGSATSFRGYLGVVTLYRLCVAVMTTLLLICWLVYLIHDRNWNNGGSAMSDSEKAARTLGVTACLVMGLLALPVSRNSILSKAMGLSWESLLFVHIFLGYSLFAITFAHMISWWTFYGTKGWFPHDILAFPMWFPFNDGDSPTDRPTGDDFTIPLVQVVYVLAIALILVPSYHTIRRAKFEVFYYLHHFFMVFYLVVLIHAHNGWYFLLPGMCCWVLDRCIRWSHAAATNLVVVGLEASSGVTTLTVRQQFGGAFEHKAGQYMMISVPAISAFQWHPFTISSPPASGEAGSVSTFHIKAMSGNGEPTWTEELYRIAVRSSAAECSHLIVSCDGPYGAPPVWSDYNQTGVMLVAGGIGVTPLHSSIRHLHQLALDGRFSAPVHLVWVVRDPALFYLAEFAETLRLLSQDSQTAAYSQFRCSLYLTGQASLNVGNIESPLTSSIQRGRPEWSQVLGELPSNSLVYACGPRGMVDQVQEFSIELGMDFFSETFEL